MSWRVKRQTLCLADDLTMILKPMSSKVHARYELSLPKWVTHHGEAFIRMNQRDEELELGNSSQGFLSFR